MAYGAGRGDTAPGEFCETFIIHNDNCYHMTFPADSEYDVTGTDTMPETARVRHFDELDDSAQEYLFNVAAGASPRDPGTLSGLNEGDVVVFTDYYHIK